MVPQRTCIGCRRVAAADDLRRVAADGEGRLMVSRTAPGRGAWLCHDETCLDSAVKRKAFERALRRPVDASSLR